MPRVSNKSRALYLLDEALFSIHSLRYQGGEIELDSELRMAIVKAIKPIKLRRLKDRFKEDDAAVTADSATADIFESNVVSDGQISDIPREGTEQVLPKSGRKK